MPTTQDLSPRAIVVDASLQPRVGGLDDAHVAELQQSPDAWPPLVVVRQGGKYTLVDGFHRMAAAENLALDTVPVRIEDAPSDGDLHSIAFALNAAHGRPLSLSDRRAFADYLLRRHPEWADREIGRRCGLSQPTVAVVRTALERAAQIEQPTIRVGAGGYPYSVGTNERKRQPGELPEEGALQSVGNAVSRLFTPADRIAQRKIARHFQRLAVALADGAELDEWDEAAKAAEAIRLTVGPERAAELAASLGPNAEDVVDVAVALGYRR